MRFRTRTYTPQLGLSLAFGVVGVLFVTGTNDPLPPHAFPSVLGIYTRFLGRGGFTTLPAGVFSPLGNLVEM